MGGRRRFDLDDGKDLRALGEAPLHDPAVLTRGREPVAVVLDLEACRRLAREHRLLQRLVLGDIESAAGDGELLDEVIRECAMLLEES